MWQQRKRKKKIHYTLNYDSSHKMACQEMKTLNSGNNKHDVITINPSNTYKLADRMWEGKDILYAESMKLPLEYRKKGLNQTGMSVQKILIITKFSHTIPQVVCQKNKFKIKGCYYLCVGIIRGSLSRSAHSPGTEQSSLLSWQEGEFFPPENACFPRTGFSRDAGFL